MFKAARWRSEKNNKINAVFKLRFHATKVSQFGGAALVLSIVPADTGRPTGKLEKSAIKDGCCYWENPVYETVKLLQDTKCGKIHDRIYHFIISTGSSKSSIVGEVAVNIADYAEATKTSSVSFPFKNSITGAVLHVSIQRVQENASLRDLEDIDVNRIKSEDRSLKRHFSNGDAEESINTNSTDDEPLRKTASLVAGLTADCRASSGSDLTLSSSDSSSGLNTPRDIGVRSTDFSQPSIVHKLPTTLNGSVEHDPHRPGWESSLSPVHDSSTGESLNSPTGGFPGAGSKLVSDDSVQNLKSDLIALERRAEVSDLELQTLRKQIVKEIKKGQDLLKEVASLKGERDAFKDECDQLKASQKRAEDWKEKNKLNFEGDPWSLLEEIKQELNYEKDMNADLRLQLQKTQESNSELILAVQDLERMLDQIDKQNYDASHRPAFGESAADLGKRVPRCQSDDDEEQKALEELVKQHSDSKEAYILEQKIMDLCSEIEMYRRDKDELETQIEQLALDYEILKQENHDMSYKLEQSQLQEQLKLQYECSGSYAIIHELESQIDNLENELRIRSKEFSDSLTSIKELESQIQSLDDEVQKQVLRFESDLEAITRDKVQHEQRAIRAEEALRMTRWKNAKRAERIQEEFKRLSLQMQSTFEENEKLATSALTEASELRLRTYHLEEMLQLANDQLSSVKDDYEAKLREIRTQNDLKEMQIYQMAEEIEEKTRYLEDQRKQEEKLSHRFSVEQVQLNANIERISAEKNSLYEQVQQGERCKVELEELRALLDEREIMLQRANMERDDLNQAIALVKFEAENSVKELNSVRCPRNEEDTKHVNLQFELDVLKAQCEESKHSLYEDELEKETLIRQVVQLKSDLKKKEDAFSTMERKLKDNNGHETFGDREEAAYRSAIPKPVQCGAKDASSLRERIKWLEEQIKVKEATLGTSTTDFLEKEKDLLNKIEELENRFTENGQCGATSIDELEVADNDEDKHRQEGSKMMEMGTSVPAINSNGEMTSREQHEIATMLKEMAFLKERNNLMEKELKEMQERYSEISLKFAEVEGERQQLVMTLRNFKNTKKC